MFSLRMNLKRLWMILAWGRMTYDVGADGIDMKFCHGYLGLQILCPTILASGSMVDHGKTVVNLPSIYMGICKVIPDENFLIGSNISVWGAISPAGFGTRPNRYPGHLS